MLSVLPDEVDSADTTRAAKLELDEALRAVIPHSLEVSESLSSLTSALTYEVAAVQYNRHGAIHAAVLNFY
jgi:hypothetical protein